MKPFLSVLGIFLAGFFFGKLFLDTSPSFVGEKFVVTEIEIKRFVVNEGATTVATISDAFIDVLIAHAKVQPNMTEVEVSAAIALTVNRIAKATPNLEFFKSTTAIVILPSCSGGIEV